MSKRLSGVLKKACASGVWSLDDAKELAVQFICATLRSGREPAVRQELERALVLLALVDDCQRQLDEMNDGADA